MTLPAGLSLGSYEVVGAIGAGGMGEVYRARDTRLKREVALKVLPAAVAGDPERLTRFHREAEVLASLNHPHIAQIYGIEESNGTSALVMELVEGEDLSQRLARGPLPLEEALPIARQIAEALEGAHDAGIIHRDLKSANIKLRPDGMVKVLDFGLAKALEPAQPGRQDLANSPTAASPADLTRGIILGTAAYMAPEQAKGKPVDRRADIWAFGCVVYEMLTGRKAFDGEDITDTIVAVMSRQPDWAVLPTTFPPQLLAMIRRCLEKDPQRRVPHMSVVRFAIDEALSSPASADPTPRAHARLSRRGRALLLTAAITVAGTALVGSL
jgi:eukaryotic-like serine/threonine-protein kinase